MVLQYVLQPSFSTHPQPTPYELTKSNIDHIVELYIYCVITINYVRFNTVVTLYYRHSSNL